jgi:hypothetical protein
MQDITVDLGVQVGKRSRFMPPDFGKITTAA